MKKDRAQRLQNFANQSHALRSLWYFLLQLSSHAAAKEVQELDISCYDAVFTSGQGWVFVFLTTTPQAESKGQDGGQSTPNQKLGKLSLFLNVPQSYDNMLFRSEWKYTTFNMLCCNVLSVLVSVLMQQPHLQEQHKTPKSQMIQTITCLQLISPAFRNSCNTFFPYNLTSFTIIFQLKTEDIFFLNTLINLQFMPGDTCVIYPPPPV